ncbi:MAG: von Willebrand factor type A domain-containing protein, partial [Elusimicrobiaceae bacterium]|nr:von Willebrand factor type A domain-containing protein [Elusimicrobiaceae bacterium]
MRLTDEEIKNKFSALDFDKQNIKQNRIYSKLAFNQEERRYGMKKFIYALGTVCIIGLLLVPVFMKKQEPKAPEQTAAVETKTEITKPEIKKPVFVKEDSKEEEIPTAAEPVKMEEEERNPFIAPYELETRKQKATMRREMEERTSYEASARPAAMARRSYMTKSASNSDGAYMAAGASLGMGGMRGSGVWGGYYSYPSADYDSMNAESYKSFEGNAFKFVKEEPLSTFSADVDTASYNIARRDIEKGRLPNKDAVRTEEFINYFTYDYEAPKASSKDPVNIITELTDSPWTEDFQIVKIGVKAKDIDKDKLPASNLVFLVDVSGSMSGNTRLPLVKKSFAMLVEKLRPQDKVSIVTYANGTNTVLDGVSLDDEGGKQRIISAMESLRASGGTNGSAGLEMAYQVAKSHFIKGGNNRIILATDGDFNIGNT